MSYRNQYFGGNRKKTYFLPLVNLFLFFSLSYIGVKVKPTQKSKYCYKKYLIWCNPSYSKVRTEYYHSQALPPPRHVLNLHFTAYHTASLRDRRGRFAQTPSGSCARFYYIPRVVSDEWGEEN